MPTAAQRQRAALLAQSQSQRQQKQKGSESSLSSLQAKGKGINTLSTKESGWEDGSLSEEESDSEVAAFDLDSWTQNYCATCDTLIEPGQAISSQTPQTTKSQTSPLKSKSGTIKARPASRDGSIASQSNFKRTNSAGRIHAAGGAASLGPSKRTGSAGSRLNALSELKPTTKLKEKVDQNARRDSSTSLLSNSSGGGRSINSQMSSPVRQMKSLGGALTPDALRQQEENEIARARASTALYCSDHCRQIDEQRNSSTGEFMYYAQQTASPYRGNSWLPNASSKYGNWASRSSNGGANTPESECTCPECIDKYSASGTIPSGASDTTESSSGYLYSKQRTKSGRLVTPQSLYPPGSQHAIDYFGNAISLHDGKPDALSLTGTASSARSSDSGSDLWEAAPNGRNRLNHSKSSAKSVAGTVTNGTITPNDQGEEALQPVNAAIASLSSSQASTTSPLRLLYRGDHRGEVSTDINTLNASTSPPQASSSGFTVGRGSAQAFISSGDIPRIAASPAPIEGSALGKLKSTNTENAAPGTSWIRNSITAAWNSFRNAPNYEGVTPDANPTTPECERTEEDTIADPTPKQSMIQRPTIRRGDVPLFANEIGAGRIPGERQITPQKLESMFSTSTGNYQQQNHNLEDRHSKAHRQQKSKDISVLPPLLGVSSRSSSSANLNGTRMTRTYSTTSSRSDAAPDSPLFLPIRSSTPGSIRVQEYGSSPNARGMMPFGTSPRRAGLGWGALTPIGPSPATRSSHHSHQQQPNHLTHHHHHHHHHHSHGNYATGHLGALGSHPHGHLPIHGRHSTTPVRMSTPRVPEDGGEMSSAELKGQDSNEISRSYTRRASYLGVPQRPNSVLSMRSQNNGVEAAPPTMHPRNESSDEVNKVKMYSVLDVPGRQPTHDRYDAAWSGLLSQKTASSNNNASESSQKSRFYVESS